MRTLFLLAMLTVPALATPVDVNRATAAELSAVVDPILVEPILKYRAFLGRFESVDQVLTSLDQVTFGGSQNGPLTAAQRAQLKAQLTVGPPRK
jgi:hypothetical protein